LDDVRQSSIIGLRDATALLSELSTCICNIEDLYYDDDLMNRQLQERSKSIRAKLDSLKLAFLELGVKLDELRSMVSADSRLSGLLLDSI
jgi:hypothetical protein